MFHTRAAYLLRRPKTQHASVFWVASKTSETSAGVAGGEGVDAAFMLTDDDDEMMKDRLKMWERWMFWPKIQC